MAFVQTVVPPGTKGEGLVVLHSLQHVVRVSKAYTSDSFRFGMSQCLTSQPMTARIRSAVRTDGAACFGPNQVGRANADAFGTQRLSMS